MRPVKLRGEVAVDPASEDFFRQVIERRKSLQSGDPTGGFLKVLANSTSYGIFAEMNRRDSNKKKQEVEVYGADDSMIVVASPVPEKDSKALWRQLNEYRRRGHFGDDLNAMFPAPGHDNDIVRNKDEIHLRMSQDRQVFWAWRGTPGGTWFGIAAAAPGHDQWLYAEPRPPTGGPEADEGWRKATDPPPDWT